MQSTPYYKKNMTNKLCISTDTITGSSNPTRWIQGLWIHISVALGTPRHLCLVSLSSPDTLCPFSPETTATPYQYWASQPPQFRQYPGWQPNPVGYPPSCNGTWNLVDICRRPTSWQDVWALGTRHWSVLQCRDWSYLRYLLDSIACTNNKC